MTDLDDLVLNIVGLTVFPSLHGRLIPITHKTHASAT